MAFVRRRDSQGPHHCYRAGTLRGSTLSLDIRPVGLWGPALGGTVILGMLLETTLLVYGVAEGDFITAGARVRIVKIEGNRVVVTSVA